MQNDTICAVSTASGMGAIAIIRISGAQAIAISDSIFSSVKKDFYLKSAKGYSVHYGNIVNDSGEVIDEVLLTLFRAPNSFTGEDSVEIACHGSLYIQQEILKK